MKSITENSKCTSASNVHSSNRQNPFPLAQAAWNLEYTICHFCPTVTGLQNHNFSLTILLLNCITCYYKLNSSEFTICLDKYKKIYLSKKLPTS